MRQWLQMQYVEQAQPCLWVSTTNSSVRRWALPSEKGGVDFDDSDCAADVPLVTQPAAVIEGGISFVLIEFL